MIQLLSKVNIIDNSGGSIGRCIKILNPHGRDYAKLGDIILISVIEIASASSLVGRGNKDNNNTGSKTRSTVSKGSMYKAVIVRTKKNTLYPQKGGATFDDNAVVLLKSAQGVNNSNNITELTPIGSRIKGPISSWLANESNYAKYQKVLSLTKHHY